MRWVLQGQRAACHTSKSVHKVLSLILAALLLSTTNAHANGDVAYCEACTLHDGAFVMSDGNGCAFIREHTAGAREVNTIIKAVH